MKPGPDDTAIAGKRAALLDFSSRVVRAQRWSYRHVADYSRVLVPAGVYVNDTEFDGLQLRGPEGAASRRIEPRDRTGAAIAAGARRSRLAA